MRQIIDYYILEYRIIECFATGWLEIELKTKEDCYDYLKEHLNKEKKYKHRIRHIHKVIHEDGTVTHLR